ncbi:hypothetical protein [Rossellomorea aquimaris]|nr:hypothetical protein [Rossellomorea aquimaris]
MRQPKESDILDRFSCGRHKEIVRMMSMLEREYSALNDKGQI